MLSYHSGADAKCIYEGCGGNRDRTDRISFCGCQLSSDGDIVNIPGLFSGDRLQRKELSTHGHPYRDPVCAARIFIFQTGIKLVLADLPGNRNGDNAGRTVLLPPVPAQTVSQ